MGKISDIASIIEDIAPLHMAEQWDNVGLQVGSLHDNCKNVGVCLDVTPAVVERAVAAEVDLLVSHHPLIFNPLRRFDTNTSIGKRLSELLIHGIAVYSAHTNFDVAPTGMNYHLAQTFGLVNTDILKLSGQLPVYKLAVYVPTTKVTQVEKALVNAGAGKLGNYDSASFKSRGIGSFRPLAGAKPYLGVIGAIESVQEYKLEMIVTEDRLQTAVKAMKQVHPYEEVAYDIIKLSGQGQDYGLGRVGSLKASTRLTDLSLEVCTCLGLSEVQVYGEGERMVEYVAICGGSGGSLVQAAVKSGADVLITGDVGYHEMQEALMADLSIIDAGHYGTERIFVKAVSEELQMQCTSRGIDVHVMQIESNIKGAIITAKNMS